MVSAVLNIPIFAGQGTAAASSFSTRNQALNDASSPAGSLLLSTCHEAFHAELASLSSDELEQIDIDKADFLTREALLDFRTERYLHNALISGTSLFLIQALRYLAIVDAFAESSLVPFVDLLRCNAEHNVGILGFSSGILPACVASTSTSAITYISRAVDAYRLAFWIGVRTQQFRVITLNTPGDPSLPWSIVLLGLGRNDAENLIVKFTAFNPNSYSLLNVSAVMDDQSVTISGHPDSIAAFAHSIPSGVTVHRTTLDTLYHSPVHMEGARQQVLDDVTRRQIRFPDFKDVMCPVRSTFTGLAIDKKVQSGSLVESVVDMLLTQVINWDVLVEDVVKILPTGTPVHLLNVGPGTGLTRSTERFFPKGLVSFVDLSVADRKNVEGKVPAKQEPIAIVGMAVNMPGAPNTDMLWRILEQGINTISEIPEHRFKVSNYTDPKDPTTSRRMNAHTGNFIDNVDEFDHEFFCISPREAKSMDPQQRILLHTAYEALENSGYVPNATPTFQQGSIGCYIGAATHDYVQNLRDDIDVYYSPGTLKAFLSGRISYAMQLSGPSIVVDTACSSSVVAIYQACRALMNNDCTAAIAGGVNVISSPDMFLGLDRGHFLSPTGQCKTFDASADGYSRSEGCGIFILKRLSDAVTENDNIMGVIRGIEVNQSGFAHSITHPHVPTQTALFRSLLENSGVDANRVNVVEAHGTGTQAGDPTEMKSIRSVFASQRSAANPLHITSIKTNIGHLEAASGAAGLAKLLLMLRYRSIPRQISLKTLNPRIAPLNRDHTVIDTVLGLWEPSFEGQPRVALLNNFGAAGSNGAILLEEFTPARCAHHGGMRCVFGLSSKTQGSLEELRNRYITWLQDPVNENVRLEDIAYTATTRRQIFSHRLAFSVRNKMELLDRLTRAPVIPCTGKHEKVVFVFSGQGGQYLGMGESLYNSSSLFRRHVDDCHLFLTSKGFPGILPIILAGTYGSGLTAREEFESYQTAIFALQYALVHLWKSWGLIPCAVVGHSLGEYASLVTAEVLSFKDALTLIANRARFMTKKCALGATGMVAVNLESATVQNVISSSDDFTGLSIACYNSNIDCTVSGPLEQLKTFAAYLDAEVHCKNVVVTVPFGYHSSAMQPILEDLTDIARQITIHVPTIPVVSNVLGDVVMPGDNVIFNAQYFSRHCVEPVMFGQGITSLVSRLLLAETGVWIEIGPHTTILPMLRSNPQLPKDALLMGSLRKQQDAWSTLTACLSQLYVSNVSLVWRETFSHLPSVSCVGLPSYPFRKSKFWVTYTDDMHGSTPEDVPPQGTTPCLTGHSMLLKWVAYPSADNLNTAAFETPINDLAKSIKGHRVGGIPLCPASVYIEQALAGIHLANKYLGLTFDLSDVILRGIRFVNPLVFDKSEVCTVRTTITLHVNGTGTFTVSSHYGSKESVHVRGSYRFQMTSQTATKFSRAFPDIARQMCAVDNPKNGELTETFSTHTVYEVVFPRVVEYAKEYQAIQSLTVDSAGMEGYAVIRLPPNHDRAKFVVHPLFIDTMLHVAGFIANMQGGINDVYICSEVGAVKAIPEQIDLKASYAVYCCNSWLADESIILGETYAIQLSEPRKIVAKVKGIHFHRVRLSSLKSGLGLAARNISPSSAKQAPNSTDDHSILLPQTTTTSFPVTQYPSPSHKDLSSIEVEVAKVVLDICDMDATALNLHTDFEALGVDSLMSIEMLGKLQSSFPEANINIQILSLCRTAAEVAQEIASRLSHDFCGTLTPKTLLTDDGSMGSNVSTVNDEHNVKERLAYVLGVAVIDTNGKADFKSLGIDSLTTAKAMQLLKAEYGMDFPLDIPHDYSTAQEVQSYLSTPFRCKTRVNVTPPPTENIDEVLLSNPSNIATFLHLHTFPALLQTSNTPDRLPLFLFHDGSGLVNYYERLSPLDRNVWAMHNPHFITAQPWDNLAQMATHYAYHISKFSSGGPVLLGGWSFGGVAAFEVALQLFKLGVAVKGVLLIDSPSPIDHVPLSGALVDFIVDLVPRSANSDIKKLVKTQLEMNSLLLEHYEPLTSCAPYPTVVQLRSSEPFMPNDIADVPAWLADRSDPRKACSGWEKLVGTPVKSWDIPGHHFEPFHLLQIQEVSRCIANGCKYLESL